MTRKNDAATITLFLFFIFLRVDRIKVKFNLQKKAQAVRRGLSITILETIEQKELAEKIMLQYVLFSKTQDDDAWDTGTRYVDEEGTTAHLVQ